MFRFCKKNKELEQNLTLSSVKNTECPSPGTAFLTPPVSATSEGLVLKTPKSCKT